MSLRRRPSRPLMSMRSNDPVIASLPTVLIVDDDPLFRLLTRLLLESRGCTVSVADGCGEALDVLGSAKPEVAIVDMVMPGEDGLETIAAMRARAGDLRFIACSGHDADLFQAELAALQVSHFLAKPFTVEELVVTIRQAMLGDGAAQAA